MNKSKKIVIFVPLIAVFLFLFVAVGYAYPQEDIETPIWTSAKLPSRCVSPADCETSSPVLVDLTGDGLVDIVVATSNGHIVAIRNDGTILWDKDVAPAFGMAANTQQIHSSPAVADIDNDGKLEIVIGAGTTSESTCTQGGVIALQHNGASASVEPGWPFLAVDEFIAPSGCRDTIFSTPAIGDLDNDGDMEVVVGGFDKRIYVIHHNGSVDPNFPIDSYHRLRFPDWDGLTGHLADTIWSSAALADIDDDGYLDIIIGTDEGDFDATFGGATDWLCLYNIPLAPWPQDYCGGRLYVINRFGEMLPGFPFRIFDIMQSSPAVYDVDQDGDFEIFVGTGTFYYDYDPDRPPMGFRIFGIDHKGNPLPGWNQGDPAHEVVPPALDFGIFTGGTMPASPAIGDVAGDSQVEIVALGMDSKLYVWNLDGTAVAGFPMEPVDQTNDGNPHNVGQSPVLGDYDGDGKMEIFVKVGWSIAIVDGDGSMITTTKYEYNPPLPNPLTNGPFYYAYAAISNNPVLGDIDGDGKLELIANNSKVYAWDLPSAGSEADWPMFRQNAMRTGVVVQPGFLVTPQTVSRVVEVGTPVASSVEVRNTGPGEVDWSTAVTPTGSCVTVSPASGTVADKTTISISVPGAKLNSLGTYNCTITFTGKVDRVEVSNSPQTVSIQIIVVDQLFDAYLPIIIK